MKRFITAAAIAAMLIGCTAAQNEPAPVADDNTPGFVLSDDMTQVKVGEDGSLLVLRNMKTGHNYASGAGLWRMFYNTLDEKEMQIDGTENTPAVSQDGNVITIAYRNLVHRGKELKMDLVLTVALEDGGVRF